jgi:hypothetical protein
MPGNWLIGWLEEHRTRRRPVVSNADASVTTAEKANNLRDEDAPAQRCHSLGRLRRNGFTVKF